MYDNTQLFFFLTNNKGSHSSHITQKVQNSYKSEDLEEFHIAKQPLDSYESLQSLSPRHRPTIQTHTKRHLNFMATEYS